jgi:hypothetical protein
VCDLLGCGLRRSFARNVRIQLSGLVPGPAIHAAEGAQCG